MSTELKNEMFSFIQEFSQMYDIPEEISIEYSVEDIAILVKVSYTGIPDNFDYTHLLTVADTYKSPPSDILKLEVTRSMRQVTSYISVSSTLEWATQNPDANLLEKLKQFINYYVTDRFDLGMIELIDDIATIPSTKFIARFNEDTLQDPILKQEITLNFEHSIDVKLSQSGLKDYITVKRFEPLSKNEDVLVYELIFSPQELKNALRKVSGNFRKETLRGSFKDLNLSINSQAKSHVMSSDSFDVVLSPPPDYYYDTIVGTLFDDVDELISIDPELGDFVSATEEFFDLGGEMVRLLQDAVTFVSVDGVSPDSVSDEDLAEL